MPYRRYSKRRNYRRRNGRRVKFSRFNTYRYRSSKAQAKQIYSLNKKINRVYKNVKPETQTYFSADAVVDATILANSTTTATYGLNSIVDHTLGVFNGRYARIKSFKIWGMLENDGSNTTPVTYNNTIGLRLILFSLKTEKYGTTSPVDIIANLANTSAYTNDYWMTAPLAPGFSTRYRLLKDKRYYLKPGRGTTRAISISMKYPRSLCCSTSMANTSSLFYPKNSVFMCYFLCNVADTQSTGRNGCSFATYLKVAYMDDNYTTSNAKTVTDIKGGEVSLETSNNKDIPDEDLIIEPLEEEVSLETSDDEDIPEGDPLK